MPYVNLTQSAAAPLLDWYNPMPVVGWGVRAGASTVDTIIGITLGTCAVLTRGNNRFLNTVAFNHLNAFPRGDAIINLFAKTIQFVNPTLQDEDLYEPKSIIAYCSLTWALCVPIENYVVDRLIKTPEGNQTTFQSIEHFAKKQIAARIVLLFLEAPIGIIATTADLLIGSAFCSLTLLTGKNYRDLTTYAVRHLSSGCPLPFILSTILSILNPDLKATSPQKTQEELDTLFKNFYLKEVASITSTAKNTIREQAEDWVKAEEFYKRHLFSRLCYTAIALLSTIEIVSFAILSLVSAPLSIAALGQNRTLNVISIASLIFLNGRITSLILYDLFGLINPFPKPYPKGLNANSYLPAQSSDITHVDIPNRICWQDVLPAPHPFLTEGKFDVKSGVYFGKDDPEVGIKGDSPFAFNEREEWLLEKYKQIPEGGKRRFAFHPEVIFGKKAQLPPTFVIIVEVQRGVGTPSIAKEIEKI